MFGFGKKKRQQEVELLHKVFMQLVYFHYTNASFFYVVDKPTKSQKVIVSIFFDCLVTLLLGHTEPQSTLDAVLGANINDDKPFFINGTHISLGRKLVQVQRDAKAIKVVEAAEAEMSKSISDPSLWNADLLPNLLKDPDLIWSVHIIGEEAEDTNTRTSQNHQNASVPISDKVIITCPSCAKKLRVPAGKSGSVRCPSCNKSFSKTT
jgi:hypothetical protein